MKTDFIPQYDLPGQADVFNLHGERTLDGDRLARETEEARAAREEAAEREKKQQPELF